MAQTLFPLTFTSQTTLFQTLTNNFSSANQDFGNTFINQYTLELVHKFPALFSEQTFALQTFPNQRYYNLPPYMRKVNTVVINVGNISGTTTTGAGFNWPVKECPSQEFWNQINMVNNITSDIPLWYWVQESGGVLQLGIYPMPAAGYNPITLRGQAEISSVSQTDYTTGTIASVPLAATMTAIPLLAANSVTLTGSWALPSGTFQLLFSDGEIILATMTNGSTIAALQHPIVGTPNYALALTASPSVGATTATLTAVFALTSGTYQMTFSDGEVITCTLTNGSTAVTFATAITGTPNNVVSVNNSTGGNVVAMTTAITVRTAQGGDIVTGSGTTWTSAMVGYMFRIAQPTGDSFPYTINQVYSTTVLGLNTSYGGAAIAAGSSTYVIGQASIIPTAYQLIPPYRATERYYKVIKKDKELAEEYGNDADKLFAQMMVDYGNKDTDPTVQDDFGTPMVNPNLAISLTQSSNAVNGS
jgi:hypothetical protein